MAEYERRKQAFAERLTALVRDSWELDPNAPIWDDTWGWFMELLADGLAEEGLQAADIDANRLALWVQDVGDHLLDPDYASDINWEVIKFLFERRDDLLTPYNE